MAFVLRALVVSFATLALAPVLGCEVVTPSNPFDPETPVDQQAPAALIGRVTLAGRDLGAAPVTLRVLRADGGEVTDDDGDRFTTRGPDAVLPEGLDGDVAGTFEIPLVPGSYRLVFVAADNGGGGFLDVEVPVTLGPGERARRDLAPTRLAEGFSGSVAGRVDIDDPAAVVVVTLTPAGALQGDATLTRQAVVVGGGDFSFGDVPSGSFTVSATTAGAAPAASALFSVAEARVDVAPLVLVPLGEIFAVVEHLENDSLPPFAPFLPSLTATIRANPGLLVLEAGDVVFVRAAEDGVADVAFVPATQDVVVTLADGDDGARVIAAELQICFAGRCSCDAAIEDCADFRAPLSSGALTLPVTVDRAPPEAVSVVIDGQSGPLVLACATFGGACPPADNTPPRLTALDATLVDVTGRVIAFGSSLDDPEAGALAVVSATGVARVRGAGPAIPADDGAHVLRVFAQDAAGNIGVVDERAVTVDVTPPPVPTLLVDGASDAVVSRPRGFIAVDVASAGEAPATLRIVTGDGGASVVGSGVDADVAYTGPLQLSLGGAHDSARELTAIVTDAAGNASTSAPVDVVVVASGTVTGRFVLEGREASTTQNGGIQVTILDARNQAVAATTTTADGRYSVSLTVDSGLRAVAFFPGFAGAESPTFTVGDGVATIIDDDGTGQPRPGVLAEDDGVLVLCRPTAGGLASELCVSVAEVNVTRLQLGGVSFDGVTDFRVSTTAFAAGDAAPAFVAVVPQGDDVVAPVVDLPAVDGEYTVFFQTRSGANVSEVQRVTVRLDRQAPGQPTLQLARGSEALLDGFTRSTVVTSTVTSADADVASLCATFALVAPTTLPGGARCANPQAGAATLDLTMAGTADGVQRAFAFACDRAGNCSTSPAGTSAERTIVLDRSAPATGVATGASVTVALPATANDGVRFHTNGRVHELAVVPGTSVHGGLEVAGVKLGLAAAAAAQAATASLAGTAATGTARVRTPEFLGNDGDDYSVFTILIDAAGNSSPAPLTHAVRFDLSPPRVVVTLPTSSRDAVGAITVGVIDIDGEPLAAATAGVTQGGTTRTTTLAGTPAATLSAPLQLAPAGSGVVDGELSVVLTLRDRAGNATSETRAVVLDRVAPGAVSIVAPTSNEHTADTTPSYRFAAVADASSYEVRVFSGVTLVRGPTTTLLTEIDETVALSQGSFTLDVRAVDAAGNTGAATTVAFVVDTTQPGAPTGLTVNGSAIAATINDTTPTLAGTIVADNLSANADLRTTVQVATDAAFDNVVFSTTRTGIGAFSTTTPALADGAYQWRFVVVDRAGNTRVTAGPAFTIDATVPATPVIVGVPTPRNSAAHSWSAVVDAARYRVKFGPAVSAAGECAAVPVVNQDDIAVTTFTPSVPATVDGCLVQFAVTAIDAAGNEGAVATVSYVLDTEAPGAATFSIQGGTITRSTTARLTLTPPTQSAEGASHVVDAAILEGPETGGACVSQTVNAAAFSTPAATFLPPSTSGATVDVALPGDDSGPRRCKTVALRVRDGAGNIGPISSAAVVELDQTAPSTPRLLTRSGSLNGGGTFALEVAEGSIDANGNFETHELVSPGGNVAAVTPSTAGVCAGSAAPLCFVVTLRADSENRYALRGRDRAGNVSDTDFVSIIEDSTAPAPPAIEARGGDGEVRLSWAPDVDGDVDHYRLLYVAKTGTACPTSAASYTGTAAEQGPSPIFLNRTTLTTALTGLPNRFAVCVALQAIDVVGNGDTALDIGCADGCNARDATPQFLPTFPIARLNATQLGLSSTQRAESVAARRGLLYVGTAGGGLLELDVTNPACFDITDGPAFRTCTGLVSSAAHPTTPEPLVDPREIVLQGGFAFVADGAGGLKIFRLKEGTAPQRVVTVANTGGRASISVAVSGNSMAVGHASSAVRAGDGFVELFDLTPVFAATPASPTLRSTVTQNNPTGAANVFAAIEERGIFGVSSVDIQGTTLAMGSVLVNITNLAAPALLANQPTEGNAVVDLAGNALVSVKDDNGQDNDLRVTDLGVCAAGRCPVVTRSIGVGSTSIDVVGPYVIAAGRGQIDLYDLSDRSRIDLVASHIMGAQSGDIVELGGVAVDGQRAFAVTGNTSPFVEVLEFGEMQRLDGLAVEGVPFGSRDAAIVDDALVQGQALGGQKGNSQEAVVHLGSEALFADSLASPNENMSSVAVDGDRILFVERSTEMHTMTRSGTGLSARTTRVVGAAAEGARTYMGGTLSWPFAIGVTGANDRALDVVVTNLVSGAVTTARLVTRGTPLGLSDEFTQDRASLVNVYGGFIWVAFSDRPFAAATSAADQGLYRIPFDVGSGGLGAPVRVTTDATQSARIDGRKIVYAKNAGTRGTAIRAINADGSLTAEVFLTTAFSFAAPMTLAGDHLFIPGNVDGLKVFRLAFSPGTSTPIAATSVVEMDYGAEAQKVHVVMDRAYSQSLVSATFLLRAR